MKTAFSGIILFLLAAASFIMVPLSLVVAVFAIATGAGEPKGQNDSMMVAGLGLAAASGISTTWIAMGFRDRKAWRAILITPLALLLILSGILVVIGASGV